MSNVVEHITRDGNVRLDISRTGDFLKALNVDVDDDAKETYEALEKTERHEYKRAVQSRGKELWFEFLNRHLETK